jgi:hypothetical protein
MNNQPLLPKQRQSLKLTRMSSKVASFTFPPKVDVKSGEVYEKRKVSLINKSQLRNLGKNPAQEFFPSSLFISKHMKNN